MNILGLGLIEINDWLLLILALYAAVHFFYARKFQYFEKMGIRGPKPYPVVGNVLPLLTKGVIATDTENVNKYGNISGYFEGSRPVLLVKDREILKQVLLKQSNNFINRRGLKSGDKYADLMMTALRDEEWKTVRSTVSPSFSTSKLRLMTRQINACAKELVANIDAGGSQALDIKKYAGCFTMDVIATTAFGLQINSQKEEDNTFVKYAKDGFGSRRINPLLLLMFLLPPLAPLIRKLNVTIIPKHCMAFFVRIVDDVIAHRRHAQAPSHTDFMQLMMNAQQESSDVTDVDHDAAFHALQGANVNKRGLTKDEVIAQSVLFFFAGYETTANAITFLAYLLALHPDHQQALHAEVKVDSQQDAHEEVDVDYSQLCDFPFLDMCCHEALRMYPPATRLERQCGKTVTINGVLFEKDLLVGIPVYSIHHDPEVYPEPEKFDPYRWTSEERAKRSSLDWIPFGAGPRNCVAMRMALTELKIAAVYLVRNFRFVQCEETKVPLNLKKHGILSPVDGAWMKCEKRQ